MLEDYVALADAAYEKLIDAGDPTLLNETGDVISMTLSSGTLQIRKIEGSIIFVVRNQKGEITDQFDDDFLIDNGVNGHFGKYSGLFTRLNRKRSGADQILRSIIDELEGD